MASLSNNLKIQTNHSDSYRTTINFLKGSKTKFHTYQTHDDKSFWIVIRNIHPSTSLMDIGVAINKTEPLSVHNVPNALNKTSKNKLSMFFIDLKPIEINKEIFHITSLLNQKIKIEKTYNYITYKLLGVRILQNLLLSSSKMCQICCQ